MELVNQLVNKLPAPAQLLAPDGSVILTNPSFNKLFGLPSLFDWNHHGLSLLTDPQAVDTGVDTMIGRALTGMRTEIHSFTYNPSLNEHCDNAATQSLTLFMTLWPLLDPDGNVVAVVCLVTDHVDSGSRYEQELMRSQKMENIERLASGIAHEFNNIFTGIKGMAELIKDEVDRSSEIFEFADSIQQNIARGAELIQQLNSFARELPITLRPKKLSDYIDRALPLMQMQVQRRVNITKRVEQDGYVLIDANRLDQALANIMLNSRDAMGGQGQILITLDVLSPKPDPNTEIPRDSKWLLLEIADSGPGIPPELAERVLEPFFTTKERGKATGLGLSVTSRIVMSHNGIIQIGKSEELGGAAIRIFLPMVEPPED